MAGKSTKNRGYLRIHGFSAHSREILALEAFALDALALHLAGAAYSLGSFARAALGGLLIMAAELHLAEHTLALQLLLERLERLIDIVVTNENLHWAIRSTKN